MFLRQQHSPTKLLIFAMVFLLLMLLWLLVGGESIYAQSQPQALGSLTGTVRDSQGNPLPNIDVWLEHYTQQYETHHTVSDGAGAYQFFSVPSGNYWLRFEDKQGVYAAAYYPAAAFAQDATMVSVNGNNVTGVEMALQVSGVISVTVDHGVPVTTTRNNFFYLYRQTASGQWASYRQEEVNTDPPLRGQRYAYRFSGLPSGAYRLCLRDSNDLECYDNVLPAGNYQVASNATDITVQAGDETHVEMRMGDLVQLKGFVYSPTGQPLAGITVVLRGGEHNRKTETDANGSYRFGFIESGNYTLSFNAQPDKTPYLEVFYPDDVTGEHAATLQIGPATHLSLSQRLAPEARIEGKVTLPGGTPLENMTLLAYEPVGDGTWRLVDECYGAFYSCPSYTYDPATGHYAVRRLVAGRYRIGASDRYNGQSTFTSFYGGSSLESATDLVVVMGQTITNVNFILGAHDFESTITGTVRADGAGRGGMEVGLFNPEDPAYSQYESSMPFVSALSDAHGVYTLTGLAAGTYLVGVRDPAGIFATTFYTTSQCASTPCPVTITGQETVKNINMDMELGGIIRGHLRMAPDVQPEGYTVEIVRYPLMVTGQYPGQTTPLPFIHVRTDSTGSFEIGGLPPGVYLVRALTELRGDAIYRYHYHPGTIYADAAQPLTVEAGKTYKDVDIIVYTPATTWLFLPSIGGPADVSSAER